MSRLPYRTIERIADAHDVGFERGRDSDGPYVRLSGFLSDIEAVERKLPTPVHIARGDHGHYLYAW